MTQDITSQITLGNVTGGNTTIDRTDLSVPHGDMITVVNNILNGAQSIDALRFEEGSAPATPGTGLWKIYFRTTGLFIIDDGGVEYGPFVNAVQLALLTTGLLKVTTGTGALSTATPGTDYQAPIRIAIIQDQKANNTAGGGSSAATWNTRALNTEVYDPSGLVTISSNKFTPIVGTYKLKATAPAKECGGHRLRLYNVNDAAVVDQGMNSQSSTGDATETPALLETVFTADGSDEYRIDHYTVSAKATDGLGAAVNSGEVERYCTVTLEKIS